MAGEVTQALSEPTDLLVGKSLGTMATPRALMVPGPMARSAAALGRVCTAVEEFVRVTSGRRR
ncbi:hypothetical protein ACSNOB_28270 [Micromonospora sp. URMC 106]|uniref:hypothetical protein n=1 Tax=Micromonospora sp. URMC 106 TaxID=3423408 RepID=UPI003F1A1C4B